MNALGGILTAVCGALTATCAVLMVIVVLLLKREKRKPEKAREAKEAERKEESGEIEWTVTKTENPTREQQYINMLMYNGEDQTAGGRR